MTTDYANGRCCAITKAGKRCTGRWSTATQCTFAHDATTGDGLSGPMVVLCRRHRRYVWDGGIKKGSRYRIVRGWLGAANRHGYGTCVFSRPTGWKPAAWWWANRKAHKSGESRGDCP